MYINKKTTVSIVTSMILFIASIGLARQVPLSAGAAITTSADAAYSVYSADIDGDGDMDTLSASANDSKIGWYENTAGDGTGWISYTISNSASGARCVYAADVDGDGDLDALSASYNDDKIAWYENTAGDGSAWTQHSITTTADGAMSVVAADVDGDGDMDVLSASLLDDKIAWYENTAGDGSSWTPYTITTSADSARSVYAADVDGDGDMDALSASYYDDKIAWYENTTGDGSAWMGNIIYTSVDGANSVYAADLDNDGDLDVAAAALLGDQVIWFENTAGDGSAWTNWTVTVSADAASSVSAADMDADGDMDILSTSTQDDKLAWYENTDGAGAFGIQQVISTSGDGANSVVTADVDGDGDVDTLLASSNDDKITWYENESLHRSAAFPAESTISTSVNFAHSVYSADIDGDGDLDALSASYSDDKIAWYDNTGGDGSSWTANTISTSASEPRSVYAEDLDGDGDLDALSASYDDDKVAWYENTAGDGSAWTQRTITTSADGAVSVFSADVDGDGDLDALSASINDSKVAWHANTAGDGSAWTAHTISSITSSPRSVYAADIDGDGDLDALSAAFNSDTIAWHENTAGDGSAWTPHTISTSVDGANSVYAADLDGDGDLDVAAVGYLSDQVVWFENTAGDGSAWTSYLVTSSADQVRSVVAADLDADGDMDLVSVSTSDDKLAWYENTDGAGTFSTQKVISTSGDGPFSVATGDVDRDGDLDVLSASSADNKIAWYENRGGQFALPTTDLSLGSVGNGETAAMLAIDATHCGMAGDQDIELVSLELLFEETTADPLTSAEANAIIENLFIYRDTGSGVFEVGTDTLVSTVGTLALTAGVQTVTFADGDSDATVSAGTPVRFFVVIETTSDAGGQTPNTAQVTHITEASSTAEDADHDILLVMEYSENVTTSSTTLPVELDYFLVD